MRYFKIRIGFGNGNDTYIPIDETELETAMYCFMSNSKGVFKNGVCRGQDILSITEDWHKEMGWNKDHIIQGDDWNELRKHGIDKKYFNAIGEVKEKVQYLMATNQVGLIGKNIKMELSKPKELSEASKLLANKMKI